MSRKIISVVSIFLLVTMFYYFDSFYLFSNNLTDRLVQEERETDYRLKILAIDDESLEEIGRWPWPRDKMAALVEDLVENGALAVFVDIMYAEESADPEEDQLWQELLLAHDNIYLPLYFQFLPRQAVGEALSYSSVARPVYTLDRDNIGHINGWEDRDRIVRHVLLGVRDEEQEMVPAMSVRLANLLLPRERQITWTEEDEWYLGEQRLRTGAFGEVPFSYASSPTSARFETFSIHRVMNGEIDPAYFADSIVFIGPYTVGLQDVYQVPNSKTRMFGVEIHANIVQSFIDGYLYTEAPKSVGIAMIGAISLLSFLTMERLSAKWSFVALLLFIGLYFIIVTQFMVQAKLILPFFYPLLAILISYIVSVISQYIVERMEKNRVTNIFGRYVAKGVVNEILASAEEIKLGGERKDVTLMFIDIRGFTPLSENLEPEEVVQILNEYLDLCSQCIFQYDGTIDKFMGDGIMVIFGAPIPQEDHAQRAVGAALMMKERSDELAKRLMEKYGRTVSFGMGINSGPAVIGNIGSKERLDYTAIGDTVNLAARLEANAKPGQILISEATYERVKDKFSFTPLEPIKVKGKEKPVNIYQVEGEIE